VNINFKKINFKHIENRITFFQQNWAGFESTLVLKQFLFWGVTLTHTKNKDEKKNGISDHSTIQYFTMCRVDLQLGEKTSFSDVM